MKAAQKKTKTKPTEQAKPKAPTTTAAPRPTSPNIGVVRVVKVTDVGLDPTQPRKHFDEESLKGLAASIKEKGLQQYPVVRENPPKFAVQEPDMIHKTWAVIDLATGQVAIGEDGKPDEFDPKEIAMAETMVRHLVETRNGKPYILVMGERRTRAVQILGWEEMPVTVRTFVPEEIAEVQLLENMQREALNALEEARGMQKIIDTEGIGKDELADRLGLSRSSVYQKLGLLKLSEVAKDAYLEGKVEVGIAELISKIPDPKLQGKALEEILTGHTVYEHDPSDWSTANNAVVEPMSFRQARQHIRKKYMLDLKTATFDTKDANLLEGVGSCVECPYRSGNCRDTQPHIKGENICTNPPCWAKKGKAFIAKEVQKAKDRGLTVLEGKQTKGLFSYGSINSSSGYVGCDETCWDDTERRTYGKLMKGAEVQQVVAIHPDSGKVVKMFPKTEVVPVLKQIGIEDREERARETPEQKAKREFEETVRENARSVIRQEVCGAFSKLTLNEKNEKALLQVIVPGVLGYHMRQLAPQVKAGPLDKFTLSELKLLLLLAALDDDYQGKRLDELAGLLKVDGKKIRKEIREQLKEEKKPASERSDKKQAKKK